MSEPCECSDRVIDWDREKIYSDVGFLAVRPNPPRPYVFHRCGVPFSIPFPALLGFVAPAIMAGSVAPR